MAVNIYYTVANMSENGIISSIVINQTWNDLTFLPFPNAESRNYFYEARISRNCGPLDPKMCEAFNPYNHSVHGPCAL
jgi:hypothetical protein